MKIAVTGIGVVSSLGIGKEAFWEGCRLARSGIGRITSFETGAFRSNAAGCVSGFKPSRFMPPMVYRRMSRIARMTLASTVEAVEDSRLPLEALDRERVAVVAGTAYGSSSHVDAFYISLLTEGPRGAQPMLFPETVPNASASHIAIFFNITGPNITFCQNEISAETAVAYAANLLAGGIVDAAVVAGAEELSEILHGCYDAVGALNRTRILEDRPPTPEPASGLILGEGAAALVMERLDFAESRKARIYGILKSLALTGGDAAMGHYETGGERMAGAMETALEQAGLGAGDIDHISVSANFSRELDRMEYERIADVFYGSRKDIRVTPLKYLTGEFGAAGATRAAAVLLGMHRREPLPTLPLEALVRRTPSLSWQTGGSGDMERALMTSSTFGGGSCGMVFVRY